MVSNCCSASVLANEGEEVLCPECKEWAVAIDEENS